MKNKHIFCNRKNGVTIKGIFFPHPRYSAIKAAELERQSNTREERRAKR